MKKKYFNITLALLACAGFITMTGCGKKIHSPSTRMLPKRQQRSLLLK